MTSAKTAISVKSTIRISPIMASFEERNRAKEICHGVRTGREERSPASVARALAVACVGRACVPAAGVSKVTSALMTRRLLTCAATSTVTNAWVENAVEDVRDQIAKHNQDRTQHQDAHQHRVVPHVQGVVEEATHAGPGKDGFDQHRAGQ